MSQIKYILAALFLLAAGSAQAANPYFGAGGGGAGGGGGGVTSLNSQTGDVNLTSTGNTVTITPSGGNINLEAGSSGPTVFGPDLTAANPQVSGDPTSGFFSPGTFGSPIAIGVDGGEMVEFGSSVDGNVLIINSNGAFVSFDTEGPDSEIPIDFGPKGFAPLLTLNSRPLIYAGSQNIMLGDSGYYISPGNGNLVLGSLALTNSANPSQNFVGGYFSMGGAQSPTQDVAIGPYSCGSIVNGSYSFCLGANVDTPDNGDDSFAINLGNGIWGLNFGQAGQLIGIGPTPGVPETSLDLSENTDALYLQVGTTAQRPATPQPGMVRYNSDLADTELYQNGAWSSLAVGDGGTPTCGTGCASITAGSNDLRGSMTGGTLVTSAVLNFASTLPTAPFCTVGGSAATAVLGASATTSTLTVTLSTALTGDVITYHCLQ